MKPDIVTLVAAIIAATVSLLTLIVNLLMLRRSEMRAAHRQALLPLLDGLGRATHTVAAVSGVVRKRWKASQDVKEWLIRGDEASKSIEQLRPRCKYVLPGLDEPLRTLSRMPNWVSTYKAIEGTNGDELLAEMQLLARDVDRVIRGSYARGLPPGHITRWRLDRRTRTIRDLWEARFEGVDGDATKSASSAT